MGIGDDIKNTAEDLKGKAKEAAGKATNDKSTTADGHADQAKAGAKKAGQNAVSYTHLTLPTNREV